MKNVGSPGKQQGDEKKENIKTAVRWWHGLGGAVGGASLSPADLGDINHHLFCLFFFYLTGIVLGGGHPTRLRQEATELLYFCCSVFSMVGVLSPSLPFFLSLSLPLTKNFG